MRKMMIVFMLLVSMSAVWAAYNVGDTVTSADNTLCDWNISGPAGHPDIGQNARIFDKTAAMKAVFLFQGQTW